MPVDEPALDDALLDESAIPDTTAVESSDLQQAFDDLQSRYLRLAADFDNFRKRQAQEREALLKYGAQNTLDVLLPVLDNLQRAKSSMSDQSDAKMLYQSFDLIAKQLMDNLSSVGLKRLSPEGEAFNPELHEAISQVADTNQPEFTILQVYQDGYCLHDRLLRPAQVVVSILPEGASEDTLFEAPSENPFQQNTP